MAELTPLPIDEVLPELLSRLEEVGAVLLRAETGAGKTTRVPPALVSLVEGAGEKGTVLVVEPRRVAARAAAARIADERGLKLGREVGYRVRFDDKTSAGTRLVFMTDGLFLNLLQSNQLLEGVAAVVFDEVHERSLALDLGLSLTQQVRASVREDLLLVLMSATLEAAPLLEFVSPAAFVESAGRLHPVEIRYQPRKDERPVESQIVSAVATALEETDGDVLVFLPGVGEIRRSEERLREVETETGATVELLYGDLALDKQQQVLRRSATRRIVLATNVAETSVTVEGVTAVVDSGLERRMRFDSAASIDRLEIRPVSRSSARQRAGRAGRECPGLCLRLWTESEESQRLEESVPEIQRVDLAPSVLHVLAWGESSPRRFPWFEAPDVSRVEDALELLEQLGAVERRAAGEEHFELTETGVQMSKLGMHPRQARLLLSSAEVGCTKDGALLAALLEERDIFARSRQEPLATDSDLLDRWRVVKGARDPSGRRVVAARVSQVKRTAEMFLRGFARDEDLAASDEVLRRCLLAAYPDRVARRRADEPSRAIMVGGRGLRLADSSGVREGDLFVALEVGGRGADGVVFQASRIEEEWLGPLERALEPAWDPQTDRARAYERSSYLGLLIDEREVAVEAEDAATLLAEQAAQRMTEVLPQGDRALDGFLARVRSVSFWHPEIGLPDLSERGLIDYLPALTIGRVSLKDLRNAPWLDVLRGSLDYRLLELVNRLAPERLATENGGSFRLVYDSDGGPPVLAARIQQLFGVKSTPAVDDGRRPVLLHLLAPNGRPQQVTADLASFWENTYEQVRKELAGRYPKHDWPKDPKTAKPPRRRRG